jgi:hypothetical protein
MPISGGKDASLAPAGEKVPMNRGYPEPLNWLTPIEDRTSLVVRALPDCRVGETEVDQLVLGKEAAVTWH